MKQRTLGKTGQSISEYGLGTAFMAGLGQEGVNDCVVRAIDHGISYFDTAADYGKGRDEQMLGEALRGRREHVFLATKVGGVEDPNGHRKVSSLMQQFEQGLQNLQTDCVDLIQIHEADQRKWWSDDPLSKEVAMSHGGPLIRDEEEYDFGDSPCVEFLHKAKEQGRTLFIGITGKDARRLARIVEGFEIDSMMVAHQYNPIYRNAKKFLFSLTEEQNVGVVGGAMLMKGDLAVPRNNWRKDPPEWMDETFRTAYFEYLRIQESSGIPLAELSLRWILTEEHLKSIVVGFKQWSDIEQNIAAFERGPLPQDLRSAIDAIGIVHPLIYQGRMTI